MAFVAATLMIDPSGTAREKDIAPNARPAAANGIILGIWNATLGFVNIWFSIFFCNFKSFALNTLISSTIIYYLTFVMQTDPQKENDSDTIFFHLRY